MNAEKSDCSSQSELEQEGPKAAEKRRPRAGSGGGWGCLPVLCGGTVAQCGVTNNLPPFPLSLSLQTPRYACCISRKRIHQ